HWVFVVSGFGTATPAGPYPKPCCPKPVDGGDHSSPSPALRQSNASRGKCAADSPPERSIFCHCCSDVTEKSASPAEGGSSPRPVRPAPRRSGGTIFLRR